MVQDEFTRLFKYIQKEFTKVQKRFDKVDAEIREVKLTVVELAGTVEGYNQEMSMRDNKLDRHERWIQRLARKVGIQLTLE